jgi:16S rRNA (cytosine1402-N4)-methyltransferase
MMSHDVRHTPIMVREVLQALALRPGMTVIDGTVGLGGHAEEMLRAIGPSGRLIAFDRDARNLAIAKDHLSAFAEQTTFVHDSFGNMDKHGLSAVDAIFLDLGFSSVHVDDAMRGFSFLHDGPLDMRYSTQDEISAEQAVNGLSRDNLAAILRQYGEEPAAERIAKAIFDARRNERITTTVQLASIVAAVAPRRGKAHPATRTFQALRVYVNDELGEISRGLEAAHLLLRPGGVMAVLSFHSLEDRLIKHAFADQQRWRVQGTKKPLEPCRDEVLQNPRARSARLRAAQRV